MNHKSALVGKDLRLTRNVNCCSAVWGM